MQIMLGQQFLDDQHDVSQVRVILLQLFDFMDRGDCQRAALHG